MGVPWTHRFFHKKNDFLIRRPLGDGSFGGSDSIIEGKETIHYNVSNLKDIVDVVIPHFDKYPLMTQKRADFLLFKQVSDLISRKEHLTTEGLHKIVSIKASINKGLSTELKAAFPDVIPLLRPPEFS